MPGLHFPVDDPTTPYWRGRDLHAFDDHRSTKELPSVADVVIIGAGYAGASVVHHLLENAAFSSQKSSVVILEARQACSGATGRNGGHLKPDPYSRASKALKLLDKAAADEVASFEARHLQAIGDLVKQEEIDCDYVLTNATDVFLYDSGLEDLNEKVSRLSQAGVYGIDDVLYNDATTAEKVSGVKGARGCFTHAAGHLWPYRLIMHVLSKAVSAGVNLQTHTPVDSVSPQKDDQGYWTINTARGSVKAKSIVYATNGYTGALLPEIAGKIVPVRGICSRIVTPQQRPSLLANSYVLRFNDHEYDYLIPRTDGSIVVGGARRDYHLDLHEWFDNSDDSALIEPAKNYFDEYMQRHFAGWEDSGAFTDQIWTGIMGYTSDGFPFVGSVPEKSGQYICAGFSGHGMPQAFLSAKAVASMIAEGQVIEDVDLPRLYRASEQRLKSTAEHVTLTVFKAVQEKLGLKN